jgi:hypothetical protein
MDVIRDCTGGQGAELVFIYEFSKNDHDTAQRYGCAPSRQCADFMDNFVHGDRYSMVVAISISGYNAVHSVLGSFDSDQFRNFSVEQVVHQSFRVHTLSPLIQYWIAPWNECPAWRKECYGNGQLLDPPILSWSISSVLITPPPIPTRLWESSRNPGLQLDSYWSPVQILESSWISTNFPRTIRFLQNLT